MPGDLVSGPARRRSVLWRCRAQDFFDRLRGAAATRAESKAVDGKISPAAAVENTFGRPLPDHPSRQKSIGGARSFAGAGRSARSAAEPGSEISSSSMPSTWPRRKTADLALLQNEFQNAGKGDFEQIGLRGARSAVRNVLNQEARPQTHLSVVRYSQPSLCMSSQLCQP
jgi:hypothetical protein